MYEKFWKNLKILWRHFEKCRENFEIGEMKENDDYIRELTDKSMKYFR